MKYVKLVGLGAWLLVVIWFEDTSDWAEENLLLAKRAFAVVMACFVLSSATMSFYAIADSSSSQIDEQFNRRLERIERKQDANSDEHTEMKQRISVNEYLSKTNSAQLDRLIWGVIGLTIATIGQLVLALLKFKLAKDSENIRRIQS